MLSASVFLLVFVLCMFYFTVFCQCVSSGVRSVHVLFYCLSCCDFFFYSLFLCKVCLANIIRGLHDIVFRWVHFMAISATVIFMQLDSIHLNKYVEMTTYKTLPHDAI